MSQKQHDIKAEEKSIPQHEQEHAHEHETEFYTHSDPHFKDHTIPEHFTKNTGIDIKDIPAFSIKELQDNDADFYERHHNNSHSIYNDDYTMITTTISNGSGGLTIRVSNSNPKAIQFPLLRKIYTYGRSHSSKSQQYRPTRGAQGDALQQAGTAGHLMNGGKDWKYPITFEHNGLLENVYCDVLKLENKIVPRIETMPMPMPSADGRNSGDFTRVTVTLTLPAIIEAERKRLIKFWTHYAIFNTHLSYRLYLDDLDEPLTLRALHPIAKDYTNPTSVYCYTWEQLQTLLNDSANKDMYVYDALHDIGFRELNQPGRFEDLKTMKLNELTSEKVKAIHKRLLKSMLPMSKLPMPCDTKVMKRKPALLARFDQIKVSSLEIDTEKAVYKKSALDSGKDYYYTGSDGKTRYLYYFEVLMIPIKNNIDANTTIISGVNYSTSITNRSYFSGQYTTTYEWTSADKNKEDLTAGDIEEIIRKSMARKDIGDNENISTKKLKVPCVVIAHLVSQKIDYRGGYGKSQLNLNPFSTVIAETIEDAVRHLPSKERYYPSGVKRRPTVTSLLEQLLIKRWNDVRANPEILNPFNDVFYDPWSQSTVWYHLTEEYIMPIENDDTYDHTTPMISKETRKHVTGMISKLCEKILHVPREALGIYASPRATMYFKGQWHSVYLKDVPELAGKGTAVIFIEKVGVVDQIKHVIDKYGIAFVNTQGHFAEYPKRLVSAIIEKGGYVVILTDFDCAGIHIAEKVIEEVMELLGSSAYINTGKYKGKRKIIRLGVDMQMLDYFVSQGIKDKDGNPIASTTQLMEIAEETYPQPKDKTKCRPAMNVVSAIIKYIKKYFLYKRSPERYPQYAAYEYIYDNFEYLTGLSPDLAEALNYMSESDEAEVIAKLIADRNDKLNYPNLPSTAKRIELDSIIKVVRANLFAQFIVDTIKDNFQIMNYNRAVDKPTEYFTNKFHILPEKVQKLFLHIVDKADTAIEQTDKDIEAELEAVDVNEVGGGDLLDIEVEEIQNERLRTEAVDEDSDMQLINESCGKLLDTLEPNPESDSN